MKLIFLILFVLPFIAANRLGLFMRLGLCDLKCMRHYSSRAGPRRVTNEEQISKSTMSSYEVRKFFGAGVLLYSNIKTDLF